MKFTKEQAVEKLNLALTNNGKKPLRMSARTLEAQTETLMALVGDEEMELDAFVEKVKPSLESVNANAEHDQSEFIKEYKKTHPDPQTPPKGDENDDPMKQLLAKVQEMEAKIARDEEAKAVEAKRREVRKFLDDNNVKDSKWIDSILAIASIGKDDNAEEKGKTYLNLYNQSKQSGPSITPGAPSSGGDDKLKEAFAAVRALRTPPTEQK